MNEQTIANLTQRLVNEEAISRAASAMDPTDVAFFVFQTPTPKTAAFAGESTKKTSKAQSFDNAAQAIDLVSVDEACTLRENGEAVEEAEEEEELEGAEAPIRITTPIGRFNSPWPIVRDTNILSDFPVNR